MMVTIIAIVSFFLTYTLAYQCMLNKIMQDIGKPAPQSRIKAKSATPIGHC